MNIHGIITPNLTPMNSDETINYTGLRKEVDRLIEGGIHGIFPVGTNGEAYALSFEEKVNIIRETVDQVAGRVPIYAGTGCVTTEETIRLSKEAEKMGVEALSVITPYFAKIGQEEIYNHFKLVAESVNIPIILYNIPARTGNHIEAETAAKLAKLPNVRGIKDSSGNFLNILAYIKIKEIREDFVVLAGNDALILSTLQAGGDGAVAGCSNVYPSLMADIYNKYKEGDQEGALENQNKITEFRKLFRYGNPNTIVKKATDLMGHNVGECRSPFNHISIEGQEAIRSFVEQNKC